jgi:hypothetical protein
MTDVRAKTRETRLAAALRANLARRKALVRALEATETDAAAAAALNSTAGARGDGTIDRGDELG